MFAGGSNIEIQFKQGEKSRPITVYMLYARPEPSFEITGYYNNNQGSRKSLFVDGKPRELIGADSIRLSKDTNVHLSAFKGRQNVLIYQWKLKYKIIE